MTLTLDDVFHNIPEPWKTEFINRVIKGVNKNLSRPKNEIYRIFRLPAGKYYDDSLQTLRPWTPGHDIRVGMTNKCKGYINSRNIEFWFDETTLNPPFGLRIYNHNNNLKTNIFY